MPGGRPSKFKEEFCQLLIDHMAQGYSFDCFGGLDQVSVCRDTIYRWVHGYPEFSDAKKKGEAKCLKFWESKGIEGLSMGKDFNVALYQLNMRNRFGWLDRSKDKSDEGVKI